MGDHVSIQPLIKYIAVSNVVSLARMIWMLTVKPFKLIIIRLNPIHNLLLLKSNSGLSEYHFSFYNRVEKNGMLHLSKLIYNLFTKNGC